MYISNLNCQGLYNKILCSICSNNCINMLLCCCLFKICNECYNNTYLNTKKCPNCRNDIAFKPLYNECVIKKILPKQRIY